MVAVSDSSQNGLSQNGYGGVVSDPPGVVSDPLRWFPIPLGWFPIPLTDFRHFGVVSFFVQNSRKCLAARPYKLIAPV